MDDDMTDADLDAFAAAGARLLGIAVAPDWQPAIRANLRAGLALGSLVAGFALPDEAEPAPVFSA
jgi:hypothetical protein